MEESTVNNKMECGLCGRVGGAVPSCQICHGNKNFDQTRAFTLTEERQGKAGDQPARYGPTGDVSPRTVNVPGSKNPGQG